MEQANKVLMSWASIIEAMLSGAVEMARDDLARLLGGKP